MNLLIQTAVLAQQLSDPNLLLVDVRSADDYAKGHLPNARQLDYARIVREQPPIGGLLPQTSQFNALLGELGMTTESLVVAYDGEGGAAASRLIWTLHAFGFRNAKLLDGGIIAWIADQRDISIQTPTVTPTTLSLSLTGDAIIDAETLLSQLGPEGPTLLDARSIQEFTGESVRANHGGRIPGAIHLEWTDAIDEDNGSRLLPEEKLQAMLESLGFDPSQHVVVYCQTHHRSALSYTMLLQLGYHNVSALEGAWSNWGNRDDTPKENG